MNILITNQFLTQYTGSELASLDLALALQAQGHRVTLACLEQGEPLLSELARHQLVPMALSSLAGQSFDLIWAQHFTTLDTALLELGISAKQIVFSSLSPYEPLESPPLCSERVNLFLANSPETQATLLSMGLKLKQIRLFANPVADDFFAYQPPAVTEQESNEPHIASPNIKLALVSNHVPPELSAALPLLAKQGIAVTEFGLEGQQCLITAKLLSDFNGIISIGRTVQYGLAMGLPVFCYDHFAGPGWLSPNNIEQAAATNFAGRCTPQAQSTAQLVAAIADGFANAQQDALRLRPFAQVRYRLSEQLGKVLHWLDNNQQPPTQPTAACYQAIGLRHRQYWRRQTAARYLNVYGDAGQGFSERICVRHELSRASHDVSVTVALAELGVRGALQNLRIDPLNTQCVVQLQRLTLVDEQQRRIDVTERVTSNALFVQQQRYHFISSDPQWLLVLDDALAGNWQHLEIAFVLQAIEEEALVICQTHIAQQFELAERYQHWREHPLWRGVRAIRQLRDGIFSMVKL